MHSMGSSKLPAATLIFPTIIGLLSLGAAVFYANAGNVRQTLYWLFAAGITAVVTY